MKKLVAFLAAISILSILPAYAKGPRGDKNYQGAGIGKEVSTEAKELKGTENKTQFGETVRTKAQEKTRIQEHKRLRMRTHQQKIKPETEKEKTTNSTL